VRREKSQRPTNSQYATDDTVAESNADKAMLDRNDAGRVGPFFTRPRQSDAISALLAADIVNAAMVAAVVIIG
jgi:hypothetical protein